MDKKKLVRELKQYQDDYTRLKILSKIKSENIPGKTDEEIKREKQDIIKRMEYLLNNINSLPTNSKNVLWYRFIEFRKLEEVASITGYSLSKIQQDYNKAIVELLKMYNDTNSKC